MIRRALPYASFLCLVATLNLYAAWPVSYDQVTVSQANLVVPWTANGVVIGTDHELVIVDSAGAVRGARKTTDNVLRLARGANDTLFVSENAPGHIGIAKLDAQLRVVWATRITLGGRRYWTYGLAGTRDGGAVAVGQLDNAATIVRLDAKGAVRWAKTLDLSGKEYLHDVIQTRDGELAAVGRHESGGWIVKLRDDGSVAWQKTVARTLAVVAESPDGNLASAGTGSIVRLDAKGEVKWQVATTLDVASIAFNGSVLAAAGRFETSMVVLTLDATGAMQWSRQLPPSGTQAVVSSGNGWLTFSSPAKKAVLQRIEPSGTSACGSAAPSGVVVAPASWPAQSLPIEVTSATPSAQPWGLAFTDLITVASPFACSQAPALPAPSAAPAPSSEFDEFAHIRDRAAQWRELVTKRDYAQLDQIGEELMKKPWSANPAQWDINVFVATVMGDPRQPEEQRHAQLRDWLAKRPESVIARVALAQSLIAAGYARRGSGFSDTVTESGRKEMEAFFQQARETIAPIKGAERIPGYWTTRIELANHYRHETVRDVALLAVKHATDPEIYRSAMHYSLPRWGGSPQGVQKLALDLATHAPAPWGDVIYMWIAYQAYLQFNAEEYRAANFEWSRINKGSRDLIAMSPKYLPSYHRYARLARRLNERAIARDLFRSPELNWYPGAAQMWNGRPNYDEARAWALNAP